MKPTMKVTKAGLVSLMATVVVSVATAATTIHVDSVTQRWPWNNKVDITYTVTDGQNVSASMYYKIVFTTVIDGTTYTIDGSTLGASANTGTQTATWTAPTGLRCSNCTMSAAIYDADVPSGNDYMIIDLTTGEVTYEGLFATQDASNARYNTDVDGANDYKESKLVLRKVPAGTHQVLADKTVKTDRDYYIGIYPVTRRQYELVGADAVNDASETEVTGNIIPHRPAVRTAWSELRTDIASTSSIPVVASANTGTFFQRLCCKTGNKYSFDLPTDLMFNLAARAGVTTTYFWGDTADSSKVVCSANSGGKRVAVGSKGANAWGLYDVNGDVWERARDTYSGSSVMSVRTDIFTPLYNPTETRHKWIGGGDYNTVYTSSFFQLDHNAGDMATADTKQYNVGFRVSVIMD